MTDARRIPTHACPGCGREGIAHRLLACQPCWYRLPYELRRIIQRVRRGSVDHREAIQTALVWYHDNPPKPRGPVTQGRGRIRIDALGPDGTPTQEGGSWASTE